MNHIELQRLLREQLSESQIRNPSYSIRAFAKRLNIGVGTLSQVLSGKRTLAPKSVLKILERITPEPSVKAKILNGPKLKLSYQQTQLNEDQYFVLSDWHYLAILNLIRTRDFKSTPKHISKRLGISMKVAKTSLERLTRMNLVRKENGKLTRTHVSLKTSDGVLNSAVRKSHYQCLDRVRTALDQHPFGSFDTTSLTFAFCSEDLADAKKKIREFHVEFSEQFSTSKKASEVYQLAIHLYSLTIPSTKPSGENK